MKLKLHKTITNDPNFFNMKLATKTFRTLMEKQNKGKQLKKHKILSTKADLFFNGITKAFFKQEIKESEQDYIYREIKRTQKYRQHLVELYGKNAQSRILGLETEPIKYDKKLLFNPYKDYEHKTDNKRYKYENSILSGEKKMNLPFIFRENIRTKMIKNDFKKNDFFNKSNSKKQNNISRYNSLNTESSSKYQRYYLTHNNRNNNSKITNSSEGNLFNKSDYLDTLDSLYKETTINQRRQKNYFNSFDYGCSFYINKCNYISKNLFK